MTYAAPGAPPAGLADGFVSSVARLASRIVTLCWVELRKIRHDRTELYTRAIQPALWLLIYGEVFTRVHAIPTPAGIPYLAYLAPGIMAQSALFIAIFYGIQIIWERDAGVLTKLMVTPTPRSAPTAAPVTRARRDSGFSIDRPRQAMCWSGRTRSRSAP